MWYYTQPSHAVVCSDQYYSSLCWGYLMRFDHLEASSTLLSHCKISSFSSSQILFVVILSYGWCICRFSQKKCFILHVLFFDDCILSAEALKSPFLSFCLYTVCPLESSVCLCNFAPAPFFSPRKHPEANRHSAETHTITQNTSLSASWPISNAK